MEAQGGNPDGAWLGACQQSVPDPDTDCSIWVTPLPAGHRPICYIGKGGKGWTSTARSQVNVVRRKVDDAWVDLEQFTNFATRVVP